jgi:tetratricopeptide (TPR) repeat protein
MRIGPIFRTATVVLLMASFHASAARAAVETGLPPALEPLLVAGRYRDLVPALRSAIDGQPQSAPLHYWLGRSLYELRDYDGAVDSLERATELAADRSEYFNWYGKACGRRAQEVNPFSAYSLARRTHRAFQAAVRLDPTNIEAQRDLIRYLTSAPGFLGGGEKEALGQIDRLSVVNAVDGRLARAEFFATRNRFDQANAEYERLQQMDIRRVGVHLEIAEYYRDRGDAIRMKGAVDEAARLVPSDARLPYFRGVALVLAKQNLTEAENLLRTYLRTVPHSSQVPSHASVHEWLGKLYELENLPSKAVAEYEAGLAVNPRSEELRKALERVRGR